MAHNKSILFISGIDFKKKSIQVIRKTPEAFAERGWKVDYLVLRDTSKDGNYFYENPFDPKGVRVHRLSYKMPWLLNILHVHVLRTIANKFISYIGVFQLISTASSLIKQQHYDAVYGYEHIGALVVLILKLRGKINSSIKITRFQGTWFTLYYKQKRYLKLILNFDFYIAMRFKSDVCIMTDDGTQGDFIMHKIQPEHHSFNFWCNGVDKPNINNISVENIQSKFMLSDKICIMSISRLEEWKRLDRAIRVVHQFIKNNKSYRKKVVFLIVGDGNNKTQLELLVKNLGIEDVVNFIGAVPNSEIGNYLAVSHVFMSFYDLSNVGNPLLESLRSNKVIMTLANGDTGKWIKHYENGFIYDADTDFVISASNDLLRIIEDDDIKRTIKKNVKLLADKKLWTWKERFDKEVGLIESKIM